MKLVLPNLETVQIDAPEHFHLAKILQAGLINYEPISLSAALALAEVNKDVFIDIGANIGVYALCVSSLRKFSYAFEPFPEASEVLQNTVDKYKLPIHVFTQAVSSELGESTLYLSDKSDMSNSLNSAYRKHKGEIQVRVTTIDNICDTIRPGLIKIDAETAEKNILIGARNTIVRDRPYLLLEVLREDLEHFTMEYFKDLNYSIYKLGEKQFKDKLINIANDDQEDLRNWLICPEPLESNFYQRVNNWLIRLDKISKIQVSKAKDYTD